MKGLLRPVGSEPARVYWVRRLVVLGVLILVLVLVGVLLTKAFGGSTEPEPKPTPAEASSEKPAPDQACDPSDLTLAIKSAPETVPAGSEAAFDVAVTNGGENACTADVGDKLRALTITSGQDRIWSSADCPSKDDESRLVLLRPGAANTATVVWDGARSDEKCTADLPAPRPGTYTLEVKMKDVKPVEHRFDIS